jgi:uncharacterized membrane protein
MTTIGTRDFNYRFYMLSSCRRLDYLTDTKSNPHMKTNILILAALSSLIAVAALLLSFRSPITAEAAVGYASVLAMFGMAALEYRINWKRLFSRS